MLLPTHHSKIHPRGQIQSPDCESWDQNSATRSSLENGSSLILLAIQESLPKPRTPAPNYNINLRFKYICIGERGVALKPADQSNTQADKPSLPFPRPHRRYPL